MGTVAFFNVDGARAPKSRINNCVAQQRDLSNSIRRIIHQPVSDVRNDKYRLYTWIIRRSIVLSPEWRATISSHGYNYKTYNDCLYVGRVALASGMSYCCFWEDGRLIQKMSHMIKDLITSDYLRPYLF